MKEKSGFRSVVELLVRVVVVLACVVLSVGAIVTAVDGASKLTEATHGVGLLACGCFTLILVRIIQAELHHSVEYEHLVEIARAAEAVRHLPQQVDSVASQVEGVEKQLNRLTVG